MNKALAELTKISNVTGKDTTLVQGGGNTSVKTANGNAAETSATEEAEALYKKSLIWKNYTPNA